MWASIEQILKPEDFNEALELSRDSGASLFTGGSYLVAKQDKSIHTLIDINHLLNDKILENTDETQFGAGCTLQRMLGAQNDSLIHAILSACPSKNIRNQRTLGGEIAYGRADSDIMVYLLAVEATLNINEQELPVPLSSWDGNGVITKIAIPKTQVKMERVSVLDSAPAFVLVAVNQTPDSISIAIGGKADRLLFHKTSPTPEEFEIRSFMDEVKENFQDDHFGSSDYKQHLVSNLIMDMVVTS